MNQDWNPELYNDKHAFVYDYGKKIVELLNPKKNERILDVGCGSGQLTAQIAKLSNEVIGIDKSPAMIADAMIKHKSILFQIADASDFHFKKKFDAIFSNATLHWVTDYKNAIRCMYNNLHDTGRIVLEFGGKGNVNTIINELRKSLANRGYITQSKAQPWYFPTISEYTYLLESAGFLVKMAQHIDRPTELADAKTGIKDWITMFGAPFFYNVNLLDMDSIKYEVQENVKSKCLIDGKWYADYKRIRIVAIKQ